MSAPSAGDLLALVRAGEAVTRSDLGRLTGLSRTAVVSRVERLVDAGLLRQGDELGSTGGRPAGSLRLDVGAGVVLAVAVGRSRSQVAVCDLAGRELASAATEHDVSEGADGPAEVMAEVRASLAGLLADVDLPVLGVGLSLPGAVDTARGCSLGGPVMRAWDGVPLAPLLAPVTDAPLFVARDAHVLARSERLARPDLADALVVKASTGLGLGVLAHGEVVVGHLDAAGELGHTKVPSAEGRPCRCGDTGCLETVAGGWAMVAALADRGRPTTHVRELVALADAGDPDARQVLRDGGRRLGEALATAVDLLNPAVVVLGGDAAAAFDTFGAGLREPLFARATPLAVRELQLVPAWFGDRAGVVGCAALALDHVLSPASVDARLAARD
ncbi:MAG: sugar kinase [Nocardioides sp.]|nr:sugar kinase [Nocardioides sp.]